MVDLSFSPSGEPFLTLPSPYSAISLTPIRPTDVDAMVKVLNDPLVYHNLSSPPFPYVASDFLTVFPKMAKEVADALIEWHAMQDAKAKGDKKWMSAMPVQALRERDEVTGEERFIGNVGMRRRSYVGAGDLEERKRRQEENLARLPGDPEIEWDIGYFLIPAVHGRGIMPATLRFLIDELWVPHFNVHKLTGAYFDHNVASKRVFEKNDFMFEEYIPDAIELQESKTGVKGKKASLTVMRWRPASKEK